MYLGMSAAENFHWIGADRSHGAEPWAAGAWLTAIEALSSALFFAAIANRPKRRVPRLVSAARSVTSVLPARPEAGVSVYHASSVAALHSSVLLTVKVTEASAAVRS